MSWGKLKTSISVPQFIILLGGKAKDLLDTKKRVREYIRNKTVQIYGSPVEMMLKVIFVPLLTASWQIFWWTLSKRKQSRRQTFELILLVPELQFLGKYENDLPDPVGMLAVRKFMVEKKVIFGEEYNLTTGV